MRCADRLITEIRKWLTRILASLLGLILLVLVLLDASQVILRYAFSRGIPWGGELAILLMITLAWFGAPLLWLQRSHLSVDLIATLLGKSMQTRLNLVLDCIAITGGLSLAWAALGAIEAYSVIVLPTLGTSASLKYYPILAGSLLLALAGLLNLATGQTRQDSS